MDSNNPKYYIGDIEHDAKNDGYRGWVVGSFLPKDWVRKVDEVEILYWSFPPGKINHPTKTSSIVEVTIILEGSIEGDIDNIPLVLKKGQYIVIKPGTINNIAQNALENVVGLTIKAPSDTTAKKVIDRRIYKRVNLL